MTNVFQFFSIQWPCYNKWLAVMHSQSMLSYFAHSLATAVSFTLQKKDERDRSMLQNVCSLISINVLQLHSQSQEVSEKKTQYIESIDFFVRQTFIGPRIEPSTCNKSMFFFRFTLSLHKVVARDKRKPIKLLNCSIAEWPWLIQHNRRRRRKKRHFGSEHIIKLDKRQENCGATDSNRKGTLTAKNQKIESRTIVVKPTSFG